MQQNMNRPNLTMYSKKLCWPNGTYSTGNAEFSTSKNQ